MMHTLAGKAFPLKILVAGVMAEMEAKGKVVVLLDVNMCNIELMAVKSNGKIFLTDSITELMLVGISIYTKDFLDIREVKKNLVGY
eukprot:8361860-Ditylum_brightwellii.AAC.1